MFKKHLKNKKCGHLIHNQRQLNQLIEKNCQNLINPDKGACQWEFQSHVNNASFSQETSYSYSPKPKKIPCRECLPPH